MFSVSKGHLIGRLPPKKTLKNNKKNLQFHKLILNFSMPEMLEVNDKEIKCFFNSTINILFVEHNLCK